VLDPLTRGATASVLDTWTAILEPTILWGLSTEPGVGGKHVVSFPRLEPDGWLVRISAPEHGESGRATESRIGSRDLPPPTQDPGTLGMERCGELTRAL
jgi:hypothetical protein